MELERAREILIRHSRSPKNVIQSDGERGRFGECRNPLCGDHVRLWVDLDGNRIQSCKMKLNGCTICTAAASLMSEQIHGLPVEDAEILCGLFETALLESPSYAWPTEISQLEAFSHLRVNRARIPCALIPWHALKKALVAG